MTFKIIIQLIILFIALSILIAIFKQRKFEKKLKRTLIKYCTIDDLLNIDPFEFEHFIANLFRALNYKCFVTKRSRDGGRDIEMKKSGKKYFVEVKRWKVNHNVQEKQIIKLHESMKKNKADRCIFVTTSGFNSYAKDYCNTHDIEMLDGNKVIEMMDKVRDIL